MSSVLSIRIRKDLKERMKRYDVDWRSEIERFIENKLIELEARERKERVVELLNKISVKPKGFASSVVRSERDSH